MAGNHCVGLYMVISIVATLYYSATYIDEFYRRARAEIAQMHWESYEIIFVNDGSPDDSLQRAIAIAKTDPQVTVLNLSRNFGHHKAIMTGLAHAKGDYIFLIDSDLEEEPEWLRTFYATMHDAHADVVYGVQAVRRGQWFEQMSGDAFYKIMDILSHSDYPRNVVTARLMTQQYVTGLLQHHEREIFIVSLFHNTGYKQIPLTVKKHSTSVTTYNFYKKMNLVINAVTAYEAPLVWIFYFGLLVSAVASAAIVYILVYWLIFSNTLPGWTSLVISIWLVGGILITLIGIIGIYLSRIYLEVKQRPLTIVRDIIRFP